MLSFCLLGVLTHAGFNPESRCKGGEKIGPLGAKQIYGEAAMKKNMALINNTFDQALKEKPDATQKFCSQDISGNSISYKA